MIDHSKRLEESVIPAINNCMTRSLSTSFVTVLIALMSADLVEKSGIEETVASCSCTKLNQWIGKGPQINPSGVLTVERIRANVRNRNFNSRMVKPTDLGVLLESMAVGDAFVCHPKSASADVIAKLGAKVVTEWQCKLEQKKLVGGVLQAELDKSVVVTSPSSGFTSLFVYLKSEGLDTGRILHPGSYNVRFEKCQEHDKISFTVPANMILLMPCSESVHTFIGEKIFSDYRKSLNSTNHFEKEDPV